MGLAKNLGFHVSTYTANTQADYDYAKGLGVNAIYTNNAPAITP